MSLTQLNGASLTAASSVHVLVCVRVCAHMDIHTYMYMYVQRLAYRVQPTNWINHPVNCTHRRRSGGSADPHGPTTNEIMIRNSDVL